jgi:hypothetical protein
VQAYSCDFFLCGKDQQLLGSPLTTCKAAIQEGITTTCNSKELPLPAIGRNYHAFEPSTVNKAPSIINTTTTLKHASESEAPDTSFKVRHNSTAKPIASMLAF